MVENFDSSLFITFGNTGGNEVMLDEVRKRFSSMGFKIIEGEGIRTAKKENISEK